jgi:hypothetical protein
MTATTGVGGRLARARRDARVRQALEGLARWIGLGLPGIVLIFLVAAILPPARVASGILGAATALWTLGTALYALVLPLARPLPLVAYAFWLEKRAGLERNELANALALERDRGRWADDPVSRDLLEICVARGGETLDRLPLRRLHAQRRLTPPLARGLLAIAPLALLAWLAPVHFGDAARLIGAAGGEAVVPRITLRVEPGSQRLERGASVTVRAAVEGRRRPGWAEIDLRAPEGRWTRARMTPEAALGDADRYSFLVASLGGDLEYRVRARWAESPTYVLRVIDRLRAVGYRKTYEPPDYTGLAVQKESASTGDLAGLIGTRVTLGVQHRRPGARGRLLFSDGRDPLALADVAPDRLEASWTLETPGTYRVELRDDGETETWLSDSFRVQTTADLAPTVRVTQPRPLINLPPDLHVTLEADAADDFGLTELTLIHARPGEDPTRVTLARWNARPGNGEAKVTYNWNLEELNMLPGQEMHYYLQVVDNDPRGPKVAETPIATIRFPTMAELYAEAEQDRQGDIHSLEETLQGQEKLRQELEQVAREMMADKDLSWEKQQEIKDLLTRQEQLSRSVDEVRQSLDASRERMENQGLFSTEVLEKVREIQDLVHQVQSTEFWKSLEQMQRALQNLDRQALKRAMEQMKLSQQELSESLDRTLQMLRRLLADEKLDRLQQQAAELEAQQAEINRQLEMGMPPDSTDANRGAKPLGAEEAQALRQQQEKLAQALEKLQQELDQLRSQGAQGLEDLKQALEKLQQSSSAPQTLEQMRQAMEAMSKSQREPSLKFGRKAGQGLHQLQVSLGQMRQQIDIQKLEALARSLYNISNRLIDVSLRQENLTANNATLGPRELTLREQEHCDEIAALADSLFAVSRETPIVNNSHLRALGQALDVTGRARDAFDGGRRATGLTLTLESMQAINAAVKQLMEAALQAQSQCSSNCPNPFNRMQTLSSQQDALNQDTQQLMGSCQTPRPTMSQQESMMRLAARQEMIQQGLEDLRQEAQQGTQMMGDLGKIAKEMEDVARELRGRHTDPRIVERQERILSRLLTAQRSLRKQDEDEKRESRPGVDAVQRVSPPAVDPGQSPVELLRRAMLRGGQDPVPPEYRRWVDGYMRSLLRTP